MVRNCDMCPEDIAIVDRKTTNGYWAYMCTSCNQIFGTGPATVLANISE